MKKYHSGVHRMHRAGRATLCGPMGRRAYGRPIFDVRTLPHDDYDVLTLITCQGYDQSSGEYNWRIVVRAVLIKVE